MTSAIEHAFRMIPYGELHESTHNPRRHFDMPALQDLAESIRKAGILTPLLVRPNAKGFEIAAGHRRYRAAHLAELTMIPCLVREMEDQTFMEILTIENLQREDVHPLDEAKGYEALMAAPYKMKVETVAAKVGKSVKYIYDRVKLLALAKEAQELFWSGRIQAGHAILLARLSPTDQAKVIGTEDNCYADGGLFQGMRGLPYDPEAEDQDEFKACSVRELEAYINAHVRFDRKMVDPILFPETAEKIQTEITKATAMGAKTDPKKTVIPITYEFCLNDDTRDSSERTYTSRSWKRADGREGSKSCDFAILGCVVAGAHRGDSFDVCIDEKVCAVHWKEEAKAATAKLSGSNKAVKAAEDKAAKARKAELARREQNGRKRQQWETMAPKIQAAVLEKVKTLTVKADGVLGDLLVKEFARRAWSQPKMTAVPRGKTAEDLVRYLGAVVLADHVHEYNAHEQFPPVARALGVDLSPFIKAEVQTAAGKKKGKMA